MRVGIYNEPGGDDLGGSECCAAVLAEALRGQHAVEIVHHKPRFTIERLTQRFETALDGVTLRHVPTNEMPVTWGVHNPFRRYAEARAWNAGISSPYDFFINLAHTPPPFNHARSGLLIVLFPYHERWEARVFAEERATLSKRLKRLYYDWEWRKRLASYPVIVSISEYSRAWTRRRWEVDSGILFPPAGRARPASPKQDAILSVGRFTTYGHNKRQDELMKAFALVKAGGGGEWRYHCVGGLGDRPDDHDFFAEVRAAGAATGADVEGNVPAETLQRLYGSAKIFWHATGLGVDDERNPEHAEHFGISTVEAMAAGCVPVVIDKGGQREIVEHGVSGFLWSTIDELASYTLRLIRDDALRARMSEASRKRAQHFSRDAFVERTRALMQPLFAGLR